MNDRSPWSCYLLARFRVVYIQYIPYVKKGILKWSAATMCLNERMNDICANGKHRNAFVLFVRRISDNLFDPYLLVYGMKPDCFGRLINARSELLCCCYSWQLRSVTPYQRCFTAQNVELLPPSDGPIAVVDGNV